MVKAPALLVGAAGPFFDREYFALERDLVQAVLANEAIIALTAEARTARIGVLDRTAARLTEHGTHVIRVESADDQPLDLARVMDQALPSDRDAGREDRVERFFDLLTSSSASERRRVLIVDDAHLLAPDTLSYLALVQSTSAAHTPRLQILLAGKAAMWDRLPRRGNLSSERITTRLSVPGVSMLSPPPAPAKEPLRAAAPPLPPAPEGHERLRRALGQRQIIKRRRTRAVTKVLAWFLLTASAAACGTLWVRFGAEARQLAGDLTGAIKTAAGGPPTELTATQQPTSTNPAQAPAAPPVFMRDAPAVAAMVVRGNQLLGAGDVAGAQLAFTQAAASGSAPGALGLAKTYDPRFLTKVGARGIVPDVKIAAAWYKRAALLGEPDAAEILSGIETAADR